MATGALRVSPIRYEVRQARRVHQVLASFARTTAVATNSCHDSTPRSSVESWACVIHPQSSGHVQANQLSRRNRRSITQADRAHVGTADASTGGVKPLQLNAKADHHYDAGQTLSYHGLVRSVNPASGAASQS